MSMSLYRIRGMLQFPRYLPTVIARAQASQSSSTTSASNQGGSSVLPKSTTSNDKTNPTKTSSDAPPLDHEHVDVINKAGNKKTGTSSSRDPKQQQSFMNSPAVKFAALALLTLGIYASYRTISGGRIGAHAGGDKSLRENEHYRRATADYQSSNTQGTDVKK